MPDFGLKTIPRLKSMKSRFDEFLKNFDSSNSLINKEILDSNIQLNGHEGYYKCIFTLYLRGKWFLVFFCEKFKKKKKILLHILVLKHFKLLKSGLVSKIMFSSSLWYCSINSKFLISQKLLLCRGLTLIDKIWITRI